MKNILISGAFLLFGIAALASTEIQKTTVHFASDSYTLEADALEILSTFLSEIMLTGDYEFQIDGHTDHEGNNSYNNALSQKRSEAVKAFFEKNGIETTTLFTDAHGKKELLYKKRDAESMRQNRRVDIVFKRFYFENTEELMAELALSTQNSFQIESWKSTTVTCSRGSRIFIPEDGFVDSHGNTYQGIVKLEIIEALDYHDFLAHGLNTLSNGEIIQTGGMLNIQAFAESGTPLDLNDSAFVSIAIPGAGGRLEGGMSLFLSNNGANWNPTFVPALNSRNLDIPKKPELNMPSITFPVHVFDESRKPIYPSMPQYPSLPVLPRQESYSYTGKWYQFFSRKRIEKSNKLRYEIAILNYQTKMAQYNERVEKFDSLSAKFPEWVAEHEAKTARWEAQQEREFEKYKNGDWKEALHAYKYLTEKSRKKYAAQRAVWDSIRIARIQEYQTMLDNLGFPENVDPSFYIFEESKLGWINCDKFNNTLFTGRSEIIAQLPAEKGKEKVILILPNSKSMINMNYDGKRTYISIPVPKKEDALVLAYKIEEGGIQIARALTKRERTVNLKYEPIKLSVFREYLRELEI